MLALAAFRLINGVPETFPKYPPLPVIDKLELAAAVVSDDVITDPESIFPMLFI
jgi:hypothetical protein